MIPHWRGAWRRSIPLLLLTLAAVAHGEDGLPFTVTAIRVEGLQRIAEGTLLNALPVNIGDSLDRRRIREALRAVHASGFFNDVELRREAVMLLGAMSAREDLWKLYQRQSDTETRKRVINALFVAGDHERMAALAQNEQSAELRMEAIEKLGLMGRQSEAQLKALYKQSDNAEVKEAVLKAFFLQDNPEALIEVARGETNSDLKNDYSPVRVPLAGQSLDTGSTKVGCFIGDHTKTALASLINTGSSIGVMTMILPGGELLPKHIPSFTRVWHGRLEPLPDGVDSSLAAARTAMLRRDCTLTSADERLLRQVFELTRAERDAALQRA